MGSMQAEGGDILIRYWSIMGSPVLAVLLKLLLRLLLQPFAM